MVFVPSFKLYMSDGSTPLYTIADVIGIVGWPDKDNPTSVSLKNLRSKGEISIPGGDDSYDIIFHARLGATGYANLISQFNTLQSTIVSNTHYVLKCDLTVSTTDDINIIRKAKLRIEDRGNLNKFLYYFLTLRANSW